MSDTKWIERWAGWAGKTPAEQRAAITAELNRREKCAGENTMSTETNTEEIPKRQAPHMQPTNGEHPAAVSVPEARADGPSVIRDAAGMEHRLFTRDHRMADHCRKDGLGVQGFFGALGAVISGNHAGYEAELRALGESINTAGGFAIDETTLGEFVDLVRAKSQLYNLGAQQLEMRSPTVRFPRFTDGGTPTITAENSALPEIEPALDAVQLHAKKLGGYCKISSEMIEDGQNFGEKIAEVLAASMASQIDTLALTGNGGSDGWLGLENDSQISAATGTGAMTDWDEILDALYQVELLNAEPTGILAHPQFWNAQRKLKSATEGLYIGMPEAVQALQRADTTKATAGTVVVGDFRQMIIGMLRSVRIETTTQASSAFVNDQLWVKCTGRFDVNYLNPHFYRVEGITYS